MLVGIAVFLLSLMALLSIPVVLSFNITRKQAFEGNVRLRWLFGLVQIQIPLFRSQETVETKNDGTPQKQKKPDQTTSVSKKEAFSLIRNATLRRRIFRFLNDFWHAIRKENIKLHMRVGLGDPAETGKLWAVVGPLAGMLASIRAASISIEPEFIDPCLELDSSGNIRIVPLQIFALVIGLMFSPIVWRAIKQMRTG